MIELGIPKTPRNSLLWCGSVGVVSGLLATAANVLLLHAAAALHIVTAKGGLFRLLRLALIAASTHLPGIIALFLSWISYWLLRNQEAFHWVTGIGMAMFYTIVIAPSIRHTWLRAALVFGTAVWLFNSFVVLPLLGEGVAGARTLSAAGMLAFSMAHFTFFYVLGWLTDYSTRSTNTAHATADVTEPSCEGTQRHEASSQLRCLWSKEGG